MSVVKKFQNLANIDVHVFLCKGIMACLLGREYSRKLQVCHVKSHVKIKGETELQSIMIFLFE